MKQKFLKVSLLLFLLLIGVFLFATIAIGNVSAYKLADAAMPPAKPVTCGQPASYVVIDSYSYDSSTMDTNALSLDGQMFSSDEEAIKHTVQAYFILRYEFLKNPTQETFSLVSAPNDPDALSWLNRENSRQRIERYKAALLNTQYLDYKFTLDYVGFEFSASTVVLHLLESHWVRYASNPDFISNLVNLDHFVTLKRTGGRWLIVSDEYPEDLLYQSIKAETEADILETIKRNYEMQSGTIAPESDTLPTSDILADPMLATYVYNRTAAKNYSDKWYSGTGPVPAFIRNLAGWDPSYPTRYCRYADVDCTNFVSQAIFQGTRLTSSQPSYFNPDYTHYGDWWYYKFSSIVDGSQPWVSTGNLFDFLTTNKRRGPFGKTTTLCGLSQGDIVFMKNSAYIWQHAVTVSVIAGTCQNPGSIIVNSHNPDIQAPLSYFSNLKWFPVVISGYRK
ncbi:MAG: amidase domain-containing protein [Chloroflexota bacterium]